MGDSFIGMIGACLYLPATIFFIWQSYFIFKEEKQWKHHKTLCHGCLVIYAILELTYLSLVWKHDKIILSAYLCHEIALFFNYLAFNCVVDFWAKTLQLLTASDRTVDIILCLTITLNFIVLVLFVCANLMQGIDCNERNSFCENTFIAQLCCSSFCLCLLSVVMTLLGVRLHIHLGPYRDSKLLIKIIAVVASCAIFYLLRVVFVIYLVYLQFYTDNSSFSKVSNDELLWFVFSKWTPYLIPSYMIAYLMRPKMSYLCWDASIKHKDELKEDPIISSAVNPVNRHHASVSSTESTFYNQNNPRVGNDISVFVDTESLCSSYNASTDLPSASVSSFQASLSMILTNGPCMSTESENSFEKPIYGSPVNDAHLLMTQK
jgi:hypothetical protein